MTEIDNYDQNANFYKFSARWTNNAKTKEQISDV